MHTLWRRWPIESGNRHIIEGNLHQPKRMITINNWTEPIPFFCSHSPLISLSLSLKTGRVFFHSFAALFLGKYLKSMLVLKGLLEDELFGAIWSIVMMMGLTLDLYLNYLSECTVVDGPCGISRTEGHPKKDLNDKLLYQLSYYNITVKILLENPSCIVYMIADCCIFFNQSVRHLWTGLSTRYRQRYIKKRTGDMKGFWIRTLITFFFVFFFTSHFGIYYLLFINFNKFWLI